MSAVVLAERSSVHRNTIGAIEAHKSSPDEETLQKLADALRVPLPELDGRADAHRAEVRALLAAAERIEKTVAELRGHADRLATSDASGEPPGGRPPQTGDADSSGTDPE